MEGQAETRGRGRRRRIRVRSAVGVLGKQQRAQGWGEQGKIQESREWGHSPSFPNLPPNALSPGGPQSTFFFWGRGVKHSLCRGHIALAIFEERSGGARGREQRSEGLEEQGVGYEKPRGRAPRGQQPRRSSQPGPRGTAPPSQRTHRSDCE